MHLLLLIFPSVFNKNYSLWVLNLMRRLCILRTSSIWSGLAIYLWNIWICLWHYLLFNFLLIQSWEISFHCLKYLWIFWHWSLWLGLLSLLLIRLTLDWFFRLILYIIKILGLHIALRIWIIIVFKTILFVISVAIINIILRYCFMNSWNCERV